MSEPRYRDWILDTIDSLRSRRARPDLERICRMVRRRHGSEPEQTRCELEKLIQERTVLKVCYKGSISYRNAAKAQRRSRKKAQEDGEEEEEEARPEARSSQGGAGAGSSSSTHSSTDQGETGESEEEEKESVCTEEHIPEEEDVRKMEVEPSCSSAHTVEQCASNLQHKSGPADELADNTSTCQSHQASAPKPHTLEGSDAAAHPAACCTSADAQPALKHDTGDLDPGVQPRAVCPTVQKDPMTAEEEMRVEESAVTPDQLVTESSNTQDQVVMRSERGGQTSLGPSEDYLECKAEIGVSSCSPPPSAPCQQKGRATDAGSQSVACCESRRDTVHWSVSDVVSYFSTAGFPEQAAAFRSQEIDGKALLLMQRSDVLTGLSIRLGPALKIYEKHVKVLQKSHFEDDGTLC